MLKIHGPTQGPPRRVAASAKKSGGGFGAVKKSSKKNEDGSHGKRRKMKKITPERPVIPGSEPGFQMEKPEPVASNPIADAAFEAQLKAISEQGRAKKEQLDAQRQAGVLGASEEIDYSNPPPMSQALGSLSGRKTPTEAQNRNSAQIGGAVVAFLLIAIFLTTDSGSVAPSSSGTVAANEVSLTPDEKTRLEQTESELAERVKGDAEDAEALEGLAVTRAQLGKYSEAEKGLQQLVKIRGSDADAWRLLGEVRAFQGKYADAADAYKRSIKESGGRADLEQLQGLAGALAGAGREAEAVAAVRSALEEASRGSASAEGAEGAANGVGEVEARLLLGKVYAQWKGHVGDATAVYDELIQKYPEDFRGYLAKGVLLRDNGSKGDAQRLFIQARYFAPPEARAIVDKISGRS